MKVEFRALLKDFNSRALASLDKGYQVKLVGNDTRMVSLALAPADEEVEVSISWPDNKK